MPGYRPLPRSDDRVQLMPAEERDLQRCRDRWRRSEQRADRMWHAYLAAEPPQRAAWYSAYERLLNEEERAAADLELVTITIVQRSDADPARSMWR